MDASAYDPTNPQQLGYMSGMERSVNDRQAPQIDQGLGLPEQQQDRDAQGQLIGTLQNDVAGRGPSAAMAQLNAGRDANINQAQSMANSARGGAGAMALAQRSAMMAGANATQQTAGQAAILRAQEMQQARQNLGTALQSRRAGDLGYNGQNIQVAGQNATLAQQQTGQNDTASQGWANLYMQAMNGDRNAQMQLEQLNSNNYNSAHGLTSSQNINNQNVGFQQGVQNDKVIGAGIGALGTYMAGQSSGGSPAPTGGSQYTNPNGSPNGSPQGWGY